MVGTDQFGGKSDLKKTNPPAGRLSAFGSGRDLRVLGRSPAPGPCSLGRQLFLSPAPPPLMFSQINKQILKKVLTHPLHDSDTPIHLLGFPVFQRGFGIPVDTLNAPFIVRYLKALGLTVDGITAARLLAVHYYPGEDGYFCSKPGVVTAQSRCVPGYRAPSTPQDAARVACAARAPHTPPPRS